MTYGQIAALVGSPRAARQVGQVAHYGPSDLPWWRVVNKQGGLAGAYTNGGRTEHKRALEADGVDVSAEYKCDVNTLLWWPSTMNKLVVLLGETASGKSALGLDIAKKYDGEIICSDSWTVRRFMDIGTAKPSQKEQQAIPHHLLDVVAPDEPFTAADFKRLANEAIADIQLRGKLPIMVGGTGLYIDAVVYDYSFLGGEGTLDRDELGAMSAEELADMARDQGIDLSDVDVRNKRRIIRAMESGGQKPSRSELKENTLLIGLKAEELQDRIEKRVDAMLEAGLEAEVKRLSEEYGWEAEALKGIGYREWRDYFAGTQSLEITRGRIISATKNLAKRQRTWFKRNPDIKWVASSEEAEALINDFL